MAAPSVSKTAARTAVSQILLRNWLWLRYGVRLHPTTRVDRSIQILSNERGSVFIGPHTVIAPGASIIAIDTGNGMTYPVHIGARVTIGAGATIMPSVRIEDDVVVHAGSVVRNNIPAGQTVRGNPARVLRN